MSREKAKAAAYDAMHDVILSTARVNGKRLAISCATIDTIGADILAGALDGIVSYAIETRPPDMAVDDFTQKIVTALQDIVQRRTLGMSTPANRSPV